MDGGTGVDEPGEMIIGVTIHAAGQSLKKTCFLFTDSLLRVRTMLSFVEDTRI